MQASKQVTSARPTNRSLEEVVDLLSTECPEVSPSHEGETVVVTGAGGSIGSKLCQRLLDCGARRFLLVESSEFALYTVNRRLVEQGAITKPLLCSYGDTKLLKDVLTDYQPSVAYHAGAYKHVPLVEENTVSAVKNNFLEAVRFFDLCRDVGIPTMVVVSSDKAVNPSSVMGATKALVEHAALTTGFETAKVVRFGNVLGSSGSVVPLFYSQMLALGTVTITDPRMTRYFMSIKQAVALILACENLSGNRFLLDMGPPTPILDIARRVADLLGLPFSYTEIGIRPGEKLHEELSSMATEGTAHPGILRVLEPVLDRASLMEVFRELTSCRTKTLVHEALSRAGIGFAPFEFDRMSIVGRLTPSQGVEDCYKTPSPTDYRT